jgi:hypothetical protein
MKWRGRLDCRGRAGECRLEGERAYAEAPGTTTGVPENIVTALATILPAALFPSLSATIDSIGSDLINMYYPVSFKKYWFRDP